MFYFEPLNGLLAYALLDGADRARRAHRAAEAMTLIDLAYTVFATGALAQRTACPGQPRLKPPGVRLRSI